LSTIFSKGKFGFIFRNTRFGNTATTTLFVNPSDTLHESFSPKILTDISINYSPRSWLTITVGANNVFNVYPDRLKNYRNTNEGMYIYGNEAMPFGYNGGYLFFEYGPSVFIICMYFSFLSTPNNKISLWNFFQSLAVVAYLQFCPPLSVTFNSD
jgi:hypothetical protein